MKQISFNFRIRTLSEKSESNEFDCKCVIKHNVFLFSILQRHHSLLQV